MSASKLTDHYRRRTKSLVCQDYVTSLGPVCEAVETHNLQIFNSMLFHNLGETCVSINYSWI